MTCPACGCTVGWDCDCPPVEPPDQDREALETAAAYALVVLARLSLRPEPGEGATPYAQDALGVLVDLLAAAGMLDEVQGRAEQLPPWLLPLALQRH